LQETQSENVFASGALNPPLNYSRLSAYLFAVLSVLKKFSGTIAAAH
jgi:hypothetical protein